MLGIVRGIYKHRETLKIVVIKKEKIYYKEQLEGISYFMWSTHNFLALPR